MIETKESKTRDIPLWLTALVILLCIGGGAWLVKWYVQATPRQVVAIPEDKNPVPVRGTGFRGNPQNGFTGNNNPRNNRGGNFTGTNRDINANGVQSWSNTSYRIKSGDTIMNVNYVGDKFDFSPRYLNVQTVEVAEMIMMRLGIMSNAGWRDYLGVTDEQLAALRAVPLPRSETLEPADKARLSELWTAYHSGSADTKAVAEKKLLAAVEEVGKKSRLAAVAFDASRADMVKAALTPEQIAKYKATGGTLPTTKEPVKAVPVKPEPGKLQTRSLGDSKLIEGFAETAPASTKVLTDKAESKPANAVTPVPLVPPSGGADKY
jgi:hypothetical protein